MLENDQDQLIIKIMAIVLTISDKVQFVNIYFRISLSVNAYIHVINIPPTGS